MGLILLIVLVLLFAGALPRYGYSRNWGYRPSGALGLILIVVLVLVLIGSIPWGFARPVYVAPRPVYVINPPPVKVVNPTRPVAPTPPSEVR
jgi:hypothetical protein